MTADIKKLETEAATHGDFATVAFCRIARLGPFTDDDIAEERARGFGALATVIEALKAMTRDEARARCAEVVCNASAMVD